MRYFLYQEQKQEFGSVWLYWVSKWKRWSLFQTHKKLYTSEKRAKDARRRLYRNHPWLQDKINIGKIDSLGKMVL